MPAIQVRSGSVNLPSKSAKLLVFISPRAGQGAETLLFAAAKNRRFGVLSLGSPVVEQAVVGHAVATHGSVTTQQFEVPEGTVLKVFFSSRQNLTRALGSASLPFERHAARYYRVRSGAAVVSMSFPLATDPRCQHQTGSITGAVEAITLEEAERAGITQVAPQFRRLITDSLWFDAMVSRRVLQEATSRAVVVSTPVAPDSATQVRRGTLVEQFTSQPSEADLRDAEAIGRDMGRHLRQQAQLEARQASPVQEAPAEPSARIVSLPVRRRILS